MNRTESERFLSKEEWEKRYTEEVFKGPSAFLPVNKMCADMFQQGVLPGTKFELVDDMALLKYYSQQNGHLGKGAADLDLEVIARESSRPQERLNTVTQYMEKYNFIP